ncbi:MAG: trypsin-like peptidase domain-containing protein [Polyangiaceae bacterium]
MAAYWESVVQISTPDGKGSGVFISPTEVLTAAHVVAPTGPSFAVSDIRVIIRYRGEDAVIRALAVHPRWTNGARAGSDIALLRVEPVADLGLGTQMNVPAPGASVMVSGIGFVAATDVVEQPAGTVLCESGTDGFNLLRSDDLAPTPGLSGGPLYTSTGGVVVVGLMTRISTTGLVGLPLLDVSLGRVRALLPP